MILFYLSGENLDLAKEEVLSLFSGKHLVDDRLLILDVPKASDAARLAFVHKTCRVLFDSSYANFNSDFQKFNWKEVYKTSFSIRIHNLSKKQIPEEKELAGIIWRSIDNPKVNLKNAKTPMELFFSESRVYVCLLINQNEEPFEKRKAHFRPGFQPVSLHPKLARGLVNLTGIKKGTIVDPLCGTGGFLIEAGLMGLNPVGYDIDEEALKNCRKNLDFFRIKNYRLAKKDATKLKKKMKYVVTDLPYGKGTSVKNIGALYSDFLAMLKKNLTKRAVIVFPDFVNYKELIKKSKLKIKREVSFYIHKSLTKKIVVIEA